MIRISITPQQTDIRISVPPQYVGKKLEVLIYALEEVTEVPLDTDATEQLEDAPSDGVA